MNADSMSSKACVELPSTSASIRIQPISYMKDDSPVSAATRSSSRRSGARPPRTGAAGASAGCAAPGTARRGSRNTAAATTRLTMPAAIRVPGKPTAGIR